MIQLLKDFIEAVEPRDIDNPLLVRAFDNLNEIAELVGKHIEFGNINLSGTKYNCNLKKSIVIYIYTIKIFVFIVNISRIE